MDISDIFSEEISVLARSSRKRIRKPDSWLGNKRKKLRQHGKSYCNVNGFVQRARAPVPCQCDHGDRLKVYNCQDLLQEQDVIHSAFWKLSDDEKAHFYGRTTSRVGKMRPRKNAKSSKRKYSYSYFFFKDGVKLQVCRPFYTSTLDINVKRVHYYHEHKTDTQTGCPLPSKRGKHIKRQVHSEAIQAVKNHILSFPTVESHYCRSSTSRKYLDANLSVAAMYSMFCANYEDEAPVREHKYREIFMKEFNLGFNVPRKDRCEKCEEEKLNVTPNEHDKQRFEQHRICKRLTKAERDRDRNLSDLTHAVVCFDLQNVISLPSANVKSFFYLRKLNVYNMTAHCSLDRTGYCALWTENVSGRSGNDMASSLIKLLEKIVEKHPGLTHITLWSDACVAQNKNRGMALALLTFLREHPQVQQVFQKFGTAGHSCVQEVDNLHSQIEKKMRKAEIFSPVGLMKLMKHVNSSKPLTVVQMTKFTDYLSKAKCMGFSSVPFTRVKEIVYENGNLTEIHYRTSFAQGSALHSINVSASTLPKCNLVKSHSSVCIDKVKDIQKMLVVMPEIDQIFYRTIIESNMRLTSSAACQDEDARLPISTPIGTDPGDGRKMRVTRQSPSTPASGRTHGQDEVARHPIGTDPGDGRKATRRSPSTPASGQTHGQDEVARLPISNIIGTDPGDGRKATRRSPSTPASGRTRGQDEVARLPISNIIGTDPGDGRKATRRSPSTPASGRTHGQDEVARLPISNIIGTDPGDGRKATRRSPSTPASGRTRGQDEVARLPIGTDPGDGRKATRRSPSTPASGQTHGQDEVARLPISNIIGTDPRDGRKRRLPLVPINAQMCRLEEKGSKMNAKRRKITFSCSTTTTSLVPRASCEQLVL